MFYATANYDGGAFIDQDASISKFNTMAARCAGCAIAA